MAGKESDHGFRMIIVKSRQAEVTCQKEARMQKKEWKRMVAVVMAALTAASSSCSATAAETVVGPDEILVTPGTGADEGDYLVIDEPAECFQKEAASAPVHEEKEEPGIAVVEIVEVAEPEDGSIECLEEESGDESVSGQETKMETDTFGGDLNVSEEAAASGGTDGKCGEEVYWEFSAGRLVLSGKGAVNGYSDPADVPWAEHAHEIVEILIGEGITDLGENCFRSCGPDVVFTGLEGVKEWSENSFPEDWLQVVYPESVHVPEFEEETSLAFETETESSLPSETENNLAEDVSFLGEDAPGLPEEETTDAEITAEIDEVIMEEERPAEEAGSNPETETVDAAEESSVAGDMMIENQDADEFLNVAEPFGEEEDLLTAEDLVTEPQDDEAALDAAETVETEDSGITETDPFVGAEDEEEPVVEAEPETETDKDAGAGEGPAIGTIMETELSMDAGLDPGSVMDASVVTEPDPESSMDAGPETEPVAYAEAEREPDPEAETTTESIKSTGEETQNAPTAAGQEEPYPDADDTQAPEKSKNVAEVTDVSVPEPAGTEEENEIGV